MKTKEDQRFARCVGVAALVVAMLLGGCGDDRAPEKPKATGSHVWRGQTDMLFEAKEQAKDVDAQLRAQEAALERARRGD
jgi:hypothetical protein